jgi:hypothetical protein
MLCTARCVTLAELAICDICEANWPAPVAFSNTLMICSKLASSVCVYTASSVLIFQKPASLTRQLSQLGNRHLLHRQDILVRVPA